MSEIEKMYENAGINKRCHANIKFEDCIYSPSDCGNYNYPDFTAEKQLEITKFLLKKAVYYDVKDDKYWFYYEECESAGYKPFDEAIAHFINKLWQDLTEEERNNIKEILE